MYKKLLTRIHQIEITSRCNLRCKYCPHPTMKREKDDMTWFTFTKAMEHVEYYNQLGSQPELSFTGMGEALLHPQFLDMLEYAREFYNGKILFATNGILLTEDIAKELKKLNVLAYISLHRPELAGPAIEVAKQYNILGDVNAGFATSAMDWAGTVDWYISAPEQQCAYLRDGWGVVLQNGDINACCWDAEGENLIGHVNDPIGSLATEIKPLCANCNLIKPDENAGRV